MLINSSNASDAVGLRIGFSKVIFRIKFIRYLSYMFTSILLLSIVLFLFINKIGCSLEIRQSIVNPKEKISIL